MDIPEEAKLKSLNKSVPPIHRASKIPKRPRLMKLVEIKRTIGELLYDLKIQEKKSAVELRTFNDLAKTFLNYNERIIALREMRKMDSVDKDLRSQED